MTSLTRGNIAAVDAAALAYAGSAAAFGVGSGASLLGGPVDLYRPFGGPQGPTHRHHQQPSTPAATTATTPPPLASSGVAEFHQHQSPFAINQLLGLGAQDKKQPLPPPPNDPLLSAHRDDYPPSPPLNVNKTCKDYRSYPDKLR